MRPGNFPARFFLHAETHQQLSPSVATRVSTPLEILELLGSAEDVQSMSDKYFSEVQSWCPFLNENRMVGRVRDFSSGCDIRLALLLLSMKLILFSPSYQQDAVTCLLYQTVKDLSVKVEGTYFISLELIQSIILISVYELGHGVFPAGFLSIAHAARLCIIMGLHNRKRAPQLFTERDTWAMIEEERRTWWIVLILDR